jgi:epoxyqueuosine reductase
MMKISEIVDRMEAQEHKTGIVSIRHLDDLQEEIESNYRAGALDETFYRQSLTVFEFSPPDKLPHPRCIIVVATRHPQIRFTFSWEGKRIPLVVPPTYLKVHELEERIRRKLETILAPEGFRVEPAVLPNKLLAVRSGLARYGKNNIAYLPGWGSFCRLTAFYSDFPCDSDGWQEPAMLETCQSCSACTLQCPGHAIDPDRFLLHADRCITYHNEQPGDVPFPSWLDPSWHNCLVGCLRCQTICPENNEFLDWIEPGADFSSDETRFLMNGRLFDRLPGTLAKKLDQSEMTDFLDILPRNLKALLDRHKDRI